MRRRGAITGDMAATTPPKVLNRTFLGSSAFNTENSRCSVRPRWWALTGRRCGLAAGAVSKMQKLIHSALSECCFWLRVVSRLALAPRTVTAVQSTPLPAVPRRQIARVRN